MKAATRTITFQPDKDVRSLLRKACGKKPSRGVRTKLINDAVRQHYAALRGKRELIT